MTTTSHPATVSAPPESTTMSAIVQREYGDSAVLRLKAISIPAITDDEVLIRVHAAGVNHADWVSTTGEPLIGRLAFGLRRPKQPVRGRDVAGVIHAVGPAVTRFRPGDAVYGELDTGTFAEYAAAPERAVALKPANLTFEQAAVVPLSARTALQGLTIADDVRPDSHVLINGASGGVGTFAVQIAKSLGAEVTAVCSARNAELARSLGADHVIDYTETDFTTGAERYDVIFDSIGNHSLSRLRGVLTRRGTLVLSSGTGGRVLGPMGRILQALLMTPFVSQTLRTFTSGLPLDRITELVEAGEVTPVIERAYPLAETGQAIRHFAERHARAKIVIRVTPDAERR
ncbi:NAD(P)-dependent alcohol dehydrogenase [Lysobacter korlensis]|uniref:NAD(P)-dependent alcohol dehydrogenase n=1 Tax=Lysobacter korlensis TaxID=553636 RepID=A0ABV6RXQ7_9GAMM